MPQLTPLGFKRPVTFLKNADLCSSIYEQAGVAVDAFAPAQMMIVSTVHRSNPDHSIHLLCKVPPLKQETRLHNVTMAGINVSFTGPI